MSTRKLSEKFLIACHHPAKHYYHTPSENMFLVEFSENTGRNIFLTTISSQKGFRLYFQKSRLECYLLCLFYFYIPSVITHRDIIKLALHGFPDFSERLKFWEKVILRLIELDCPQIRHHMTLLGSPYSSQTSYKRPSMTP